jgi:long-subunit fatty acid transport protein
MRDVALAVSYRLNDRIALRAGYRILEGGADVEEVYNFALVHFLSFGVTYTF